MLRQVYVRLYWFGSRGHGIMHRGTFGGSAIGVSQYALKYRNRLGDSGVLCGDFAENKYAGRRFRASIADRLECGEFYQAFWSDIVRCVVRWSAE